MKITLELLRQKRACREQQELFARTFPEGVTPTRELVRKYGDRFDLNWAAEELLDCTGFDAFVDAWADASRAHNKALAPASRAYREAVDPVWERWHLLSRDGASPEECEAVHREYVEVSAAADVAYLAADAPLEAVYRTAVSDAFYDVWVQQYPEDAT